MTVEQRSYKGWDISYSTEGYGFVDSWCAQSPDFLVDRDQSDFFDVIVRGQQIFAPTYDALITEIDNAELEKEFYS
jgi:hypothetical protein